MTATNGVGRFTQRGASPRECAGFRFLRGANVATAASEAMLDIYTPADRAMLDERWATAHLEVAKQEESEWHQLALDRWYGPYCPKLGDDELHECHQLIDDYVDARLVASAEHRDRLRVRARHLAGDVAAYRLTLEDSERRLDALATQLDVESPIPHYLLPWAEARAIVREAFAEALR